MTELVFRQDPYAVRCEARVLASGGGRVVLDRTVFYPTSGGQPGDRGRLHVGEAQAFEVIDTVKGEGDEVVHCLSDAASPPVGAPLQAELDWARRHRLMRMHSALHLLCAAVGQPVTGGQVGEHRGRLDFDLAAGVLDKDELAARIAGWIADDRPIRARWIDADELTARPELVRTMSVKPPLTGGRVRLVEIEGLDLQACGGTHVRSTGEIGEVLVGKIENKGRQNRRVHIAFPEQSS